MSAILPTTAATSALVQLLSRGMPADRHVYDHRVPPKVSYPFVLVTGVTLPAPIDGSHGDPESNVELAYSIEAVGTARVHCQATADRVRTVLMDRDPAGEFKTPLAVPGWLCTDRRTQYGVGAIEREGDRNLEVFVQRTEYVLTWVPA